MAAGGGAAFYVTHSSSNHASKEIYGTFGAFGVSYGWTGKQVLARMGAPDEKTNTCWTYRVRNETLGGTTVPAQIGEIVAVRYCFAEGVVSTIKDHWAPGAGWAPWTEPVTYGCGGRHCVVTS